MELYPWERVITRKDAVLLSDGYWEVTYLVTQKRSMNGEDWETKEASFSQVSRSRADAESDAWVDMMQYLAQLDYNLFSDFDVDEEDDAEYLH